MPPGAIGERLVEASISTDWFWRRAGPCTIVAANAVLLAADVAIAPFHLATFNEIDRECRGAIVFAELLVVLPETSSAFAAGLVREEATVAGNLDVAEPKEHVRLTGRSSTVSPRFVASKQHVVARGGGRHRRCLRRGCT